MCECSGCKPPKTRGEKFVAAVFYIMVAALLVGMIVGITKRIAGQQIEKAAEVAAPR